MAGTPNPAPSSHSRQTVRLLTFLVVWAALGALAFWMFHEKNEMRVEASQEVRQCVAEGGCEGNYILKTDKPVYRFVAMGDWGAGSPMQMDVAKQMTKLYHQTPFDMVLMLGDNIYPNGNIKKYADAYFNKPYKTLIDKRVRFVVALGNHDVLGGYQKDQKAFFKMPAYYYSVKKPDLDVFVINTNTFANDKVQQRWLNSQLEASKERWTIVMGHHPIYTSGEHGFNSGLQKTLEPILVNNKVDLYLAGHDHDYERFALIKGVQHIVSGGGGAYLRDFEKVMPQSLVRKKANHFLVFELLKNELGMQAIDKTGQVLDSAVWTKEAKKEEKLPKAS